MRSADTIRTGLARRLRRDSTSAETRLWNRLRSRAIDGHKFVRQQPIGRYIADFVAGSGGWSSNSMAGSTRTVLATSSATNGCAGTIIGFFDSGITT